MMIDDDYDDDGNDCDDFDISQLLKSKMLTNLTCRTTLIVQYKNFQNF